MIKLAKRVARTKIENFLNTNNPNRAHAENGTPRFPLILFFELITKKGIKPEIALHNRIASEEKKVVHSHSAISAKNSYARTILMRKTKHDHPNIAGARANPTDGEREKCRWNAKFPRTCFHLQGTTILVKVATHSRIIVDAFNLVAGKKSVFSSEKQNEFDQHKIVLCGGVYENNVVHINQLQKLAALEENAFPLLLNVMQKNRTTVSSILGVTSLQVLGCISHSRFVRLLCSGHLKFVAFLAHNLRP